MASDALAAAFCGDATRRDGLLGGVNSAGGKGSPRRGGSQVEIPSMGAIIGEHAHARADDDVANGGVRCATPGLFPWGGGAGNGGGGRSKTRRRTTEFAGGRVPNEWLLTHQLLEARATLCANEGGTTGHPNREHAGVGRRVRVEGAGVGRGGATTRRGGGRALAREIGGDVTAEDVAAVHAAVCANAFALEAMCTRLNYGAGFFRAAAYVNHSCDPNCLSLRLGGNMAIFAARDVAAGEELTHSYLPSHQLLLPSAARRPLLTFDCACPRCARNVNGRGADGNGNPETPEKTETRTHPRRRWRPARRSGTPRSRPPRLRFEPSRWRAAATDLTTFWTPSDERCSRRRARGGARRLPAAGCRLFARTGAGRALARGVERGGQPGTGRRRRRRSLGGTAGGAPAATAAVAARAWRDAIARDAPRRRERGRRGGRRRRADVRGG